MQYRKVYKQFSVSLVCGLMMTASTAIADRYISQYPPRVTGEQGNPWALPQTPNNASGFHQMPKTREQQYQSRPIEKYNRGFRFVTPEILESLKQQQIQTQLVPGNNQYPLMSRQSMQNTGYPSFGMGCTNPSYDTPAVSPWSSGSDILYSGESLPFEPKEEIGELVPHLHPAFW